MLSPPAISLKEIAYLQSLYPLLEIKPPTAQMNQALMYYLHGYSVTKAANMAGYTSSSSLSQFINSEAGQVVLDHIRKQQFDEISITRELLNTMLLDAHSNAGSATEQIMAIRELGKLNDLYPGSRSQVDIVVTKNIDNLKQLQRLPVEELMKLAGEQLAGLLAPPEPLEGVFDRVYTDEELAEEQKILKELDI